MFDLPAIQAALRQFGADGWLLYDFRASNVLARRVLQLDTSAHTTRRFFYCVPARGEPKKLVHRIESGVLDHLPGEKQVYLTWQELERGVANLMAGLKAVAMEYSPRNANPYVARVDAGTVELVKGLGVEVVPSGDLVQLFEATWDDDQWALHLDSARHTCAAFDVAWRHIATRVRRSGSVRETAVQKVIVDHFTKHGLVTDHPPIVAVGPHSGNPHYSPQPKADGEIREGDFVLIDLWAKMDRPRSVYSDYTRVAFVGERVPEKYAQVFATVARARDAAIARVRQALAAGRPLRGFEVDQAARDVIEAAGHGQHFVHRTGHSIGQETHGNGANMDNLETHDDRLILPRTCFSIEPGIYLADFGIRSEVNVFIDATRQAHVTGEAQTEVLPILGKIPGARRKKTPARRRKKPVFKVGRQKEAVRQKRR